MGDKENPVEKPMKNRTRKGTLFMPRTKTGTGDARMRARLGVKMGKEAGEAQQTGRVIMFPSTVSAPGAAGRCPKACTLNVLEMTGVGMHEIPTERAEIRATIEIRNESNTYNLTSFDSFSLSELIKSVQVEVTNRSTTVIDFLKSEPVFNKIIKLKTTGISLEPIYKWVDGSQVLKGYRATNSLSFRVETDYASDIITQIVKLGVTRIDGVSFVSSPAAIRKARSTAIRKAVQDGTEQALAVLDGATPLFMQQAMANNETFLEPEERLKLDSVTILSLSAPAAESGVGYSFSRMEAVDASMISAKYAAPMPMMLEPGGGVVGEEKTVTATVRIKFRY